MPTWLQSETEVLRRIASHRQTLANTIDFALASAFPYPEHTFGQSVYLGINVPREALGLSPKQRPGDIDYLLIPIKDDAILVERVIAIEAKIVRPTLKNPARNANGMGGEQVQGLLRDGFPFVGLVHISVPEPLPPQLHWTVPHVSNRLGISGELIETGEKFQVDPFPLVSAARQEGRVLALRLPEEVGYRVIAMTLSKDGERFAGYTLGEDRRGARNPQISSALVRSVEALLMAQPRRFARICWYD